MKIKNAQYRKNLQGKLSSIECEIDGQTMSVPLDPANRHYAEILKQDIP